MNLSRPINFKLLIFKIKNYSLAIGNDGFSIKTIRKYFKKFKLIGGNIMKEILDTTFLNGIVEIDECCNKFSLLC
jgi:hypothetical protein